MNNTYGNYTEEEYIVAYLFYDQQDNIPYLVGCRNLEDAIQTREDLKDDGHKKVTILHRIITQKEV
jgi:hypothetical protein